MCIGEKIDREIDPTREGYVETSAHPTRLTRFLENLGNGKK